MKHAIPILLLALASAPPAQAFDPFQVTGIDQKPDARVPLDLPFTDASGAQVTLRTLAQGKPLVIAPVLHRCPNICGVTLSGLAQAVRAQSFVPGTNFALVAFGIDPKEGVDAAQEDLAALRKRFPQLRRSGVHALTGTAENVAAVTQALGYRYAWDKEIGQYAHVAAVAVLTADGRLSHWLYGLTPTPTDLKLALTEAGEGQLGTFGDQILLLCYHYDPTTGRYGSLVSWLLRVGGGVTVALGVGLIGLAVLRERRARGESS